MKLLIITQSLDENNPVLGFFVNWVRELAKRFEWVTVICLEKGSYNLPDNVAVFSLGKEMSRLNLDMGKIGYIFRFYKYIWQERNNYDAVFVHMNQEYVLLAGDLWRLMGKRVYLWRNHPQGNILTRLAVFLSDKVFCTSLQSFTARFKKTRIMPVGIDTDFFKPDPGVARVPHSILFLGRIAPAKKVLEFIKMLDDMNRHGRKFSVTIAGSALSRDKSYEKLVQEKVLEYGLADKVKFIGAVTQEEALKLYQSHEEYTNLTNLGHFDKTILEAAACETEIFVNNPEIKDMLDNKKGKELRDFVVENHSLKLLTSKLKQELG